MAHRSYFGTVGTKGQLVIPADLREQLGIAAGDRISLTATAQGLLLEPYRDVLKRLRGKYKSEVSATTELLKERRSDAERKGF